LSTIRIITDSCASLPDDFYEELNIIRVPYYIHHKGEVYRDLVDINRDDFSNLLKTTNKLPTTACPGPGDYVKAYKDAIFNGADKLISIHMTSKGSGAFQAAKEAKTIVVEQYRHVQIEVIDTLNVSLCQGWMVIEAARAAMEGLSIKRILENIQEMIPITKMIQTADTLKYLYLGGRIGLAQRLVGSILNIKPLIGMDNGVIVPLGRARSRKSAYQMMLNSVERNLTLSKKIKIAFVHADAVGEAQKIKEAFEQRIECVETIVAELSPALAVHTGPGTAGICYFPINC
jgi:DegV family protein with EDD domain